MQPGISNTLYAGAPRSDRNRTLAGVLNFIPGAGRIYLGYWAIGVLQLVCTFMTCGVLWVWSIIDGIIILSGGVKTDGYGRALPD
jgi:TM2 domain-containing membrane protein YozV